MNLPFVQLAETVLEKVQSIPQNWFESPLPSDDPTQRKPDISLAQKVLRLGAENST